MGLFSRIFARAGCVCALVSSAAAQPLAFDRTIVGPASAGDCKAIGDLDGDGKPDAILGGSSLVFYAFSRGLAPCTIAPAPLNGEFSTDAQAVDIDSDGDIDVVIGDGNTTSNLVWYENPRINPPTPGATDTCNPANWRRRVIGTQGEWVHDIEVADLDGDGLPEVVSSGHGITRVWKRSGSGTWSTRTLSTNAGSGVFLGDIDRDGRRDIATHLGWLKNPGDVIAGTWAFFPVSGASGDEVLLADLNADGRLDMVTLDAHNRNPVVGLLAPADPRSPGWTSFVIDPFMASHHPEPADFNADGRTDLLMGIELEESAVYINLGGNPPVFTKAIVSQTGGHNARAGDINGDGRLDVFSSGYIGNPPAAIDFARASATPCRADWNADGSPTPQDIFAFLASYFQREPRADFDASGTLAPADIFAFLNAYFDGC